MPPVIAVEVEPAAPGRVREKRLIKDITTDLLYGEGPYGQLGSFFAEPSILEIFQAVAAEDTDNRPYDDDHKPGLYAEFEQISGLNKINGTNLGPYIDTVRKYHARRVAYFVLTEWENPIIGLDGNGNLRDGGHRLRAAMFLGWDEVWVDYPAPALPGAQDNADG